MAKVGVRQGIMEVSKIDGCTSTWSESGSVQLLQFRWHQDRGEGHIDPLSI